MQEIAIERAQDYLRWLLQEANKLRRYQGKPFLSKKDIKKAWYTVQGIYRDEILSMAEERRIVFQPDMGCAEVDRIIDSVIPQKRTGIGVRSMQWAVSKSTRKFIYNLADLMENETWLIKNVEGTKAKAIAWNPFHETNKDGAGDVLKILWCPFCNCGCIKHEERKYQCINCKRIFFEEDGIWYYYQFRYGRKCKKEKLMPRIDEGTK